MRLCRLSALLFFLLGVAGPPALAAGRTVSVLGCVRPGIERGCLVISDRKTGKTYQINAANPKPDPAKNVVVALRGRIAKGAVDFCQQGPILTAIEWTYTEMPCGAGK